MNVSGPIIDLIAADATANSLLAGRVYFQVLKQSTAYPAAAVNVKDTQPLNTKNAPSDLDRVMVQIDIYATTPSSAAEAAEAVRGAIDYQSTGALEHIEFKRSITGLSEKPELFRTIQEYTIMLRR